MTSAATLQKQLQKMYVDGMVKVQRIANEATDKEMKFNAAEAEKSRNWQEEMSNTSHQREVADLKAAGLNPVLSVNSGAQAYSAASASASAKDASGSAGSMMSSIMSSLGSFVASKYASDSSAAATRYAARQNRAAAEASASATRYAADLDYQKAKDERDWREKHDPKAAVTSWITNTLDSLGLNTKNGKDVLESAFKKARSAAGFTDKGFIKESKADKHFHQYYSWYNKDIIHTQLMKLGYAPNRTNAYNFYMYSLTGKQSYLKRFKSGMTYKEYKSQYSKYR